MIEVAYHQSSNERIVRKISRTNPRTKETERPWRNRAHQFVLAAPRSGAEVLTTNYLEAVALVQAGHSIRMSDGRNQPNLVTPASLTIAEARETSVDQLWLYTMPKLRFTHERLEEDIRKALAGLAVETFCVAGQKAADAFLGTPLNAEDIPGTMTRIKLGRSKFARLVLAAYDSAFRVGEDRSLTSIELTQLAVMIGGTFSGAKRHQGNPVDEPDSAVRQTMLCAHWRPLIYSGRLFDDDLVNSAPITRLAILSSMTEPGVRNALAKRKIGLPFRSQDYQITIEWLQSTRGFVPLREDERAPSIVK